MADVILEIKIPEAKVTKAAQGFLALYPNNETIPDPEWVDPEDGSEAPKINKYLVKDWVEEVVMRNLIRDVHRGLKKLAIQSITVDVDNDVATRE